MNPFQELLNIRNIKNNINYTEDALEHKTCLAKNDSTICDGIKWNKYRKEAKNNLTKTNNAIQEKLTYLSGQQVTVKNEEGYKQELKDFYKDRKEYYDLKQNNLEKLEKTSAISNRMTNFYSKKTETVLDFTFYLKILYWILFVVIIILLIAKKQYAEVKFLPMILAILLFPLIFMKSLIFQMPVANKQVKISSIFDYLFENFQHYKIDNIYFISFIIMGGLILIYTLISKLPFKVKDANILPN